MVDLGPHLDGFVASLFGIEEHTGALARATHALDPVHACKRLFVQRQAVKKFPDPSGFDAAELRAALVARIGGPPTEPAFATAVARWEAEGDAAALDTAQRYAAWATLTAAGRTAHAGGTLFHVPQAYRSAASGAGRDRSSTTASPCCACRNTTGGSGTDLR